MTKATPYRWPWFCGVCGSHAESYTEEGARDALDAHFRLHPLTERRPLPVAKKCLHTRTASHTAGTPFLECLDCHAWWMDDGFGWRGGTR